MSRHNLQTSALAIDLPADAPAIFECAGGAWARVGYATCFSCRSEARRVAEAAGEPLAPDAGVYGVHVFISMN